MGQPKRTKIIYIFMTKYLNLELYVDSYNLYYGDELIFKQFHNLRFST